MFFTSLIEEGIKTGVFARSDSRAATLTILGGIRSVLLYYGDSLPAPSSAGARRLATSGSSRADPAQPFRSSGRASAMIRKIVRRSIRW